MERKTINKDYVIQALTTQVANLSLGNAQNQSIIISLEEENERLREEIEKTREDKIKELDKQADEVKKTNK